MEVAAAVVLAIGAGLLVRSFLLVQDVDPGFSRDRGVTSMPFGAAKIAIRAPLTIAGHQSASGDET